MKYENYEGSVESLIQIKLKEIEEKENVKVLYAVESGSRAWGFASPDSDYDVRFVYVRSGDYYLGLQAKKDFIDWELNETLDINGWDITKALQHFHKSNAVLFEWANSPIVYLEAPEWKQIKEKTEDYFSCKSAMYHYYGTANKNYYAYLTEEMVRYKKYFYVLRPILACKWIEKRKCAPPVLFRDLTDAVLEENMKPIVDNLVEMKTRMAEAEKGERIEKLNHYILENLVYYKQQAERMKDDRKADWEGLNQVFIQLVHSFFADPAVKESGQDGIGIIHKHPKEKQ